MALSISPISSAIAAQAAALDVPLQPGTVVTAQVLKLLDADLVRIAIAGLTLDVATSMPLQPGQSLRLAVAQTASGLSLTPVPNDPLASAPDGLATQRRKAVILDDIPPAPGISSQSAVRPALTPLEARAVAVASQTAATQQSGLSPLFANLTSAAVSGSLPQPVLQAAIQLLALRQPSDQAVTGADIKAALATSGLLSEASRNAATVTLPGASSQSPPDMKAALIVLRYTLSAWLGQTTTTATPPATTLPAAPQAKEASALPAPIATPDNAPSSPASKMTARIAASAIPLVPAQVPTTTTAQPDPVGLAKILLASAALDPEARASVAGDENPLARTTSQSLATPSRAPVPPPFRDALPSAQAVAIPSLAPDAEPTAIAQQLIADTDGALARQTLLQVASLPDQVSGPRNDAIQPRWNFEIPFVTPQGTAMAQFEIARDGGRDDVEAAKRIWRARFSIDIEPAGPVHALISFSGDMTSIKMWAERPATAATLRASVPQLDRSLGRASLKTGDIVIADGAPMRPSGPRAGHFVNRAS